MAVHRLVLAAALAAGTVAAGAAPGRAADPRDGPVAAHAVTQALETARTGQSVPWFNSETGNGGRITVTRTYYRSDGVPCRDFTRTVDGKGDGDADTVTGSGCRTGRGTWGLDEATARRPTVVPRRDPVTDGSTARAGPSAPREADGDGRKPERRPSAAARDGTTEAEMPAKPAAIDGGLPSRTDG